jgi:hypothetical protein
MIYKYQVEQVSPNHYMLPRTGNMKCQVDAFLSPALHATTDEGMWDQAVESASYDGVTGHSRARAPAFSCCQY